MKQKQLKLNLQSIENEVEISDGYHTFDELYEHRITLYIALCRKLQDFEYHGDARNNGADFNHKIVWRSHEHSDGTMFIGQFILGIGRQKGKQITYHLPMWRWEQTNFAETFNRAPEYDGHTSADVLERINQI